MPPTDADLAATCAAVHEATAHGWSVDRPGFEERRHQRSTYAVDPSEWPVVDKFSREWTAVGLTELRCVREMARCLGGLKAGRWLEWRRRQPRRRE